MKLWFGCLYLIGAAMAAAGSENLFPNGGLEKFTGDTPEHWSIRSWNNEYVQASWGETTGRDQHGKAFAFHAGSPMMAVFATLPRVEVSGGGHYVFKGYYRSLGARKVDVKADFLDAGGKVIGSWMQRLPDTGNRWIAFFDELTPPEKCAAIQFSIEKKHTGGRVEFDDFSLRRGSLRDFASEFKPVVAGDDPDVFPIFSWVPPQDYVSFPSDTRNIYNSDRAHAEYAYCNHTVWGDPAFGVKKIIYADHVTPEMNDDPMIFNVHGGDEPRAEKFPELIKQRARVRNIAPGLDYSNNLLPVYGFGNFAEYEEYLEEYFSSLKPKSATYDHYAFFDDGSFLEDYFPNLEVFRRVAKKHHADYGIIVQLLGFGGCRSCDEGEMRFQAYSALAYGCKVLGWFTFFEPVGEYDDWHDATIDTAGRRTRHYALLREINGEVLQLGKTLLKLEHRNAYFNSAVPRFGHALDQAEYVKSVDGGDAVIGEFIHPENGKKFVMVMNRSWEKPATLHVTFSEATRAAEISARNGETGEMTALPEKKLTVNLKPGEGKLFQIKE